MSSEHKGLIKHQLETFGQWKDPAVKIKDVDVMENSGYICRGGRRVAIQVAHIEYKNEERLWEQEIFPPDQALILSDSDFKSAKIEQAVLVTGRVSQDMMMEEFIDQACRTAGCEGGANCLKLRNQSQRKK